MVDGQPVMGPGDGEAPALQEAAADGEPQPKKKEEEEETPEALACVAGPVAEVLLASPRG